MFPVAPRFWADDSYRADAEALLALCEERDLGVMAIKAASARPWTAREGDDGEPRHATTWYEPYTDPESVARGIRFALSTPGVHAFCTPGDLNVLRTALDAAGAFAPMDEDERAAAAAATASEGLIFPIPS
jgi:hypothetical protein